MRKTRSRTFLIVFSLCLGAFFTPSYAVTDQIVAVVGLTPLTLRDVRIHSLLESLAKGKEARAKQFFLSSRTQIKRTRSSLVERMVILNYLQMSGLSLPVPPERKAKLRNHILSSFASHQAAEGFFSSLGVEFAEVDRWILERLQVEILVSREFASRINLEESEVRAHYEAKKSSRYLGKSWENVKKVARADLFRDRLKSELEKWLEIEMTRVGIVLLPLRHAKSIS